MIATLEPGDLLAEPLAIERELCERRFRYYIEPAWEIVEPVTPFVPGMHIDAICEHLQAISDGEIKNLIINVPPRHMKSLLTCVLWPTWEWTIRPEMRYLCMSYADALAIRDSLKCRRIIRSAWYQRLWGNVFQLTGDQNAKTRFENDRTGFRIAAGVGGLGTGEGGNRIVVDDPIKAADARSDTMLQNVIDWWDGTMSTRRNSQDSARVIIMQRLHERDLTGHILSKMAEGGTHYEHLCLPAEYEPRKFISAIGWQDPRTEPGELLWPELNPREYVEELKRELGEYGAAGQLQQRPTPEGGGIFKKEWWSILQDRNRYDLEDKKIVRGVVGRWIFFDTAMKDADSNDYSCGTIFELWPDYRIGLRHVWMDRIQSAFLPKEIARLATRWNRDGKLQRVVIEDRNSGTTAIQTLRASADDPWLANLIEGFVPNESKEYRARQASIWCEKDCVLFPYPNALAEWYFATIDDTTGQLFKFPNAEHDDFVDTFSMGLIYLEHYLEAGWRSRNATGRGGA